MGRLAAYKLPLKTMRPGVETFHYHLGKEFFEIMESADIHDADLDVTLTVNYKDDLYNLDFKITGTVTLICDRCLDTLVMPVDTSYALAVEYGDRYDDESDTLLMIPSTDNYLNVAYMLYDTVALTIPIKHVHPAGQCNKVMSAILKKHRTESAEDMEMEMEADDARQEATDPRWDGLKGLAEDLNRQDNQSE